MPFKVRFESVGAEREEQHKDEYLKFVKQWLNNGNPLSKDDFQMRSTKVARGVIVFNL